MFKIKICGITTADNALLAAEAGADAIGLNFYANSPRFVSPDLAGEIVERPREDYSAERVRVFGVFVNASLDDILWTIREGNLFGPEIGFGIQLHGDEPPELIRDLHREGLGRSGELLQVLGHVPTVPVVAPFAVAGPIWQRRPNTCRNVSSLVRCHTPSCSTPMAGAYGGTGRCVDWSAVAIGGSNLAGLPVILAGGLTAANVGQAISTARPSSVDVASGVESSPGRKDAAKVYAFAAAAKGAFAKLA